VEGLTSGAGLGAFGAIIVANILLSGDNAVVIAMAARSLPQHQQRKAIFWGSAACDRDADRADDRCGAAADAAVSEADRRRAADLDRRPALVDSEEEGEVKSHGTLGAAVRTILIADLVMSLDNVIAVAGAAARAPEAYRLPLLVIGLVLSIR
jgi:predicted tellurium resistance membrane protein TerC